MLSGSSAREKRSVSGIKLCGNQLVGGEVGIYSYYIIVSIIYTISMISKMSITSIISIYVGGDAQHDLQPQLRHRLTNFGNLRWITGLIEYE